MYKIKTLVSVHLYHSSVYAIAYLYKCILYTCLSINLYIRIHLELSHLITSDTPLFLANYSPAHSLNPKPLPHSLYSLSHPPALYAPHTWHYILSHPPSHCHCVLIDPTHCLCAFSLRTLFSPIHTILQATKAAFAFYTYSLLTVIHPHSNQLSHTFSLESRNFHTASLAYGSYS